MPIFLGSRYETSVVDFLSTTEDGTAVPVVRYSFGALGRVSYAVYTWRKGDRLDLVASKFYPNSEMWWLIPYYNPQIKDFQNIAEGTVLRIANV
jgi:hypothetical protein